MLKTGAGANDPRARPTPTVVGLGELIWDMLPGGKQLGGAPTNFAYVARLLGNDSFVASRVGADGLGREALARLGRMGVSTRYLQLDPSHPTGTVAVQIGERGEPRFAVNENSAWDYLEWSGAWEELARRADAVCFGTLGQRKGRARETITRFLSHTRPDAVRVFDVNLRHSFFTAEMLGASLELASVVKLNREELSTAAAMLGLRGRGDEELGRRLVGLFDLDLIAVTLGEDGSMLISEELTVEHPGFHVRVVDTIGAGDAFAAALTHHYLRRAPLNVVSEAANRAGAWVATQSGATPEADPQAIRRILTVETH